MQPAVQWSDLEDLIIEGEDAADTFDHVERREFVVENRTRTHQNRRSHASHSHKTRRQR